MVTPRGQVGPVVVVHPVDGDETDGTWTIPPGERAGLAVGLAGVLDDWAAAGPAGLPATNPPTDVDVIEEAW
jgi:hypothetical protein